MDSGVMLAQTINWLIAAVIIVVACIISQDAREKGLPLSYAIGWFLLTLFVFPIGIALYFLLGRRGSKSTG